MNLQETPSFFFFMTPMCLGFWIYIMYKAGYIANPSPFLEILSKSLVLGVSIAIPFLFLGWFAVMYNKEYLRDIPGWSDGAMTIIIILPFLIYLAVLKKLDRAWVAYFATSSLVQLCFRSIIERRFSLTNTLVIVVTYLISFGLLVAEDYFVRWLKGIDFEKLAHKFIQTHTETSTP